ncbi:MAG: site-2 protease family protein [Planctomycetota bacterium]
MGWQDRDYASDGRPSFGTNPLLWLVAGRVRLFQLFGVEVYAHASLLVISLLVILFGTPFGVTPLDRVTFVVVMFGVILLHEFGHIWGARKTGGEGKLIEMTPLGGRAFAEARRGWFPHTFTVAAGPAVNVIICVVCALILYRLVGFAEFGPFSLVDEERLAQEEWLSPGVLSLSFYLFYIYSISYFLLLFNLLPIFPLDGGQLLQGLLWSKLSWFRATLIATGIGLVGSVLLVLYGLAAGGLLLVLIGASCGMTCFSMRKQLQAAGPYAFQDEDEPGWMKSVNMDPDEPVKESVGERMRRKREERRVAREAEAASRLEQEVDRVLAKISQSGIDSLTSSEKATLERAREAKAGR